MLCIFKKVDPIQMTKPKVMFAIYKIMRDVNSDEYHTVIE